MTPESRMYSLEQIAERLGLNVRTVRGYVRSGRLKAVRIGKQYRVTREDLETFTGPMREPAAIPRHRHVEASSVVQIEALSREGALRVSNHLLGAASSAHADDTPLRIETIYDAERASMKVIAIGTLADAADLFRLLGVVLETT